MNRWDLINFFIKECEYQSYLEIGLDSGLNFNNVVELEIKESVDPAHGQYSHAKPTHKMTSDEFFKTVAVNESKKYDIIFIDGLHYSYQVDKDIQNSLNHLNEGGTIILHDCCPVLRKHQIIPRESVAWNGDVWKSIVRFRNLNNGNGCVIPDDSGLGIIRKDISYPLKIKVPGELTWEWLVENREEVLGLKDFEDIRKIIKESQVSSGREQNV